MGLELTKVLLDEGHKIGLIVRSETRFKAIKYAIPPSRATFTF